MKKKILAMALSLTLALGLAACGSPQVSGPVDRESVTSTDDRSSEDSSSKEESSSEEESSAEDNSSALSDWYNGKDRKALEETINKMFESSGITCSISVEEPDTIIYTYQYTTETLSNESNKDAIADALRSSLDSQYQTFVDEIKNYNDTYDLSVKTLRVTYLDSDGASLYTVDFTEDYVPSADNASTGSASQEYATLEDWMNSEEQDAIVSAVNSSLESSGLAIDFYAEGNVMVMDYTYTEQQDLSGLSQEDIASVFDEQVAPTFSGMVSSLFESFETDYGLVLDDIKLIFRNADGTELYSKYYSEL